MALAHHLGFLPAQHQLDAATMCALWQQQCDLAMPFSAVTAQLGAEPLPQADLLVSFSQYAESLIEQVRFATTQGCQVKPVLLGPLSYLWQWPSSQAEVGPLDRLAALLEAYDALLLQLAGLQVSWVQLDEPLLTQDLPQAWRAACERAYHQLQRAPLKLLLSTAGGALEDNLGLVCNLPVDALHVDLPKGSTQLLAVLDRLPGYKVLSLGVLDAAAIPLLPLPELQQLIEQLRSRLGTRLWLANSVCPLGDPSANSLFDPHSLLTLLAGLATGRKKPAAIAA